MFVDGFDFGAESGTFVIGESGGQGDDVVGVEIAGRDVVDVPLRGRPDEFPQAEAVGFLNEAVVGKRAGGHGKLVATPIVM